MMLKPFKQVTYKEVKTFDMSDEQLLAYARETCWEYRNDKDWRRLIYRYYIPDCLIDTYASNICWLTLTSSQEVNSKLLDKYNMYLDEYIWEHFISKYSSLSADFIRKYQDKLKLSVLVQYCTLPEDVLRSYLESLFASNNTKTLIGSLKDLLEYQQLPTDLLAKLPISKFTKEMLQSLVTYQILDEGLLRDYWGYIKNLDATYKNQNITSDFINLTDYYYNNYNNVNVLATLDNATILMLYDRGKINKRVFWDLQLTYTKPFDVIDMSFVDNFVNVSLEDEVHAFVGMLCTVEKEIKVTEEVLGYFYEYSNYTMPTLLTHQKFSENFITKFFAQFMKSCNYPYVAQILIRNQKLSEDWVVKNLNYLLSLETLALTPLFLYAYQGFSEDFLNTYVLTDDLKTKGVLPCIDSAYDLTVALNELPTALPIKVLQILKKHKLIDWTAVDYKAWYKNYADNLNVLLSLMPKNYYNELPWPIISTRLDLKEDFIIKYGGYLQFDEIYSNYKLSDEVVFKALNTDFENQHMLLSNLLHIKLSQSLLLGILEICPLVSHIETYIDYFDNPQLYTLTTDQELPLDFIEKNYRYLDKKGIASSQKLSTEFIVEHIKDLPLHSLLINPYISKVDKLRYILIFGDKEASV